MEQLFFLLEAKVYGGQSKMFLKGLFIHFRSDCFKAEKLHSFSAKSVTHFARVIKVQNLSREPCN